MKEQYDRLILSEGLDFSTNSTDTFLNNNVVVVGDAGAGKTCKYDQLVAGNGQADIF